MVEDAKRVIGEINCECDEQDNLMTYCKWPTPLQNTLASPPSPPRHLIWRVKRFLDP